MTRCVVLVVLVLLQVKQPIKDDTKSIIQTLKRPSDTNVKSLAKLFPSCNSAKKPNLKFDPTSDCVASKKQGQKKAATPHIKARSKCVKVVLIKEFPCCIPKGPLRCQLTKMGRLREVSFTRVMSDVEVRNVLLDAFKALGCKNFRYLQAQKNSSLKIVDSQILDGHCVIKLAGSGSLYIQELSESNDASSVQQSSSRPAKPTSVSQY